MHEKKKLKLKRQNLKLIKLGNILIMLVKICVNITPWYGIIEK